MIDEVLVMLMRGPHSYTGEDTVEINCHGGVYVCKANFGTGDQNMVQDRQSQENLQSAHF